jgi:3'-phosphoadenosine 5'-phosphosulfate sulfotransferase (PAPS reductase)/FAD synthetase
MSDPYFITGPALISFSGGRTSAYMLYHIIQAHGGALPDDVVVAFANTGKEREETLGFVHECGSRWGVHIRWVEWRPNQKQAARALVRARPKVAEWLLENATEDGFVEVGFNSASRNGEPFSALIAHRGFAPYGGTPKTRYCSPQLKIRALEKFARNGLGWDRWVNPVGLRYDEGHRVLKQLARNDTGQERFTALMPLSKARVTKSMVLRFWLGPTERYPSAELPQGFDLGLLGEEGNCDGCMLKKRSVLMRGARKHPGELAWWKREEALTHEHAKTANGRTFFADGDTYAAIERDALSQRDLFEDASEEHDAECGLWCQGEAV